MDIRGSRLSLYKIIITGILLAQVYACSNFAYAQNLFKIDSAEVAFEAADIHGLENISEAEWQKVSLPFKPDIDSSVTPFVWFRMPLAHLEAQALEAIYIPHHAFDIEVYVDGYQVGEKKGPGDKYAMGWNTPLLFDIPEYLRVQQVEMLHIKLRTAALFTFLPAIEVGDSELLQKRFNQRYFSQVKAAEWGWIATILLGLFSFFLWIRRISDKQYLQFAVLCFSWSVVLLYMFLPYSPVSPALWLKIGYASSEIAGIAMFFFVNSMMNFKHQLLEKVLVLIMAAIIVVYFILPINKIFYIVSFGHVLALLFVIYALGKTIVIAVKNTDRVAVSISIGGAWVVLFISYDVFAFARAYEKSIALPDFTIMQHGFLFLLATFFILLIKRFMDALDNSEDLNNTLEEKIHIISKELKKSYEATRLLEITRSSEMQRQNIMRDLHDDIGAKLISIASSMNTSEQAELGREALISMKEIVSQSNSLSNDINSTIIMATTEMEARFESANIAVVLMADQTLDEILVSPQTCYHLSRILREITSNIIKHSKASEVSIQYQFSEFLDYEIRDNGIGMDVANNVGNGLRNIQFRINAIHGVLSMRSEQQGGLTISLRVPLTME